MKFVYSKVQPDVLCHIICTVDDFSSSNRTEVVPSEHFIQCAMLNMPNGTTFRPHKHITKERLYQNQIAQESWVVIRGKVKCILYDIDDTVLETPILTPGDASFTLIGGHNYEVLEPDTLVYEYKTGPYEGQKLDKVFLNV